MNNNSKKNEGFTLIEVIISIAVIAVFVMGVYGIVTVSMKNNKDAEIQQQAAMYGQQVFEDFRSLGVTKTISDTNLELSNGLVLIGDATSGYETVKDLGNRYKADITVVANSSRIGTALNKQIDERTINESDHLTINLIKKGESVEVENDNEKGKVSITDDYDSSKPLTLLVYTKLNTNEDGSKEKEIIIKTEEENELLSETFPCDTEEQEKKAISLVINFKDYEIVESSIENVMIKVSNEDKEDVNIIAKEKSASLLISLEQYGSGEFKFYDEKSNRDLYDITVNIKRDGTTIFNGSASQNMKAIKSGGE